MESRREKLEKQKARIEARLKALDAREAAEKRKQDTRRKIVVGGAVLAHAAHYPAFAAALRAALAAAVSRPQDRQAVADWLGEAVSVEASETKGP
jgi:hypothetical protein